MIEEKPTQTVTALESRWVTSNGADTIWLEKGQPATVPAHLAKWLIEAGYAEAA